VATAFALAPSLTVSARQQAQSKQRGTAPTTAPSRMMRSNPLGFSVVLVVGDLQGAPGDGDVPPAARQALTDMKDFLPYKSYKLLDAAWIMSSFTHATTRLRGPEEREFEIDITAQPAGVKESSPEPANRIYVQFLLRDAVPETDESIAARKSAREATARDQLAEAEAALKVARDRLNAGIGTRAEVQQLEQNVAALREKLATASPKGAPRAIAQAKFADRALMNTSFTMDIGETVVVGTSRLRTNSKALIALLTAVPQRGSRSSRE